MSVFACLFMQYLYDMVLWIMIQLDLFHMYRLAGEDSDGDYSRDSSSDGSIDYEFEKGMKFSREPWPCHNPENGVTLRMGRLSLSEKHSTIQEGFSSDDSEAGNSHGHLLFEFLECNPPHGREPFADKVGNHFL